MVWHEALKGLLSRSGQRNQADLVQGKQPQPVPDTSPHFQSLATPSNKPDTCLSVDLTRKQQAFEGFGTSLCWWANVVGGFPEPLRSQLVDLVFDSERGLGLQVGWLFQGPACLLLSVESLVSSEAA